MAKHRYDIGQRVQLARGAANFNPGRFTVTRQMPAEGKRPMYRIKGDGENYERVAQEGHLEGVAF